MHANRSSCAAVIAAAVALGSCRCEEPTTGNVHGNVSDAWVLLARNDWHHVGGATVVLDGGERQTVADGNGWYQFLNVPVGEHVVTATAPGYDSASRTITIVQNGGLPGDLEIWPTRGRWLFDTGALDIAYASPALSRDEATVYVGTAKGYMEAPVSNNALVAIDVATGDERWRVDLGTEEVRSSPAVADDGSIYFVGEARGASDTLRKVASDGTALWSRTIGAALSWQISSSTPAIAADGTVYVCGDGLYAYTPAGDLGWHLSPGELQSGAPSGPGDLRCSPAISADGTVYATAYATLVAVTPGGTVSWRNGSAGTGGYAWLWPPSLGSDGTIYVGDDAGVLHAFNPADGSGRWSFDTNTDFAADQKIRCAPAIGADGTVYVGTKTGGRVYAIAPDGTKRWSFEQPDVPAASDVYTSPAIGADGAVYAGSEAGYVYALEPDGTLRWRFQTEGGIDMSSPAVASDGTLFVGNMRGHLCAIRTGSAGLQPGSPWPRFRRTNQNTGLAAP